MGSIVAILLFSLSLIFCLLLKYSVIYALIVGYIIFITYGLMKGYDFKVLIKKSFEGVLTVKYTFSFHSYRYDYGFMESLRNNSLYCLYGLKINFSINFNTSYFFTLFNTFIFNRNFSWNSCYYGSYLCFNRKGNGN